MRSLTSFAVALSLVASVVACSASSEDTAPLDETDQGTEQDITTAKAQFKGSWTISDASKDLTSNVAYEFRTNGEFFRDSTRVLNGVLVQGAPRPVTRDSGRYTVNTSKHEITLHITSPIKATEVVSYDYTPGRILNGVFLPGHAPDTRAHLTLTGQAAPRSHVAFPALKFDRADSYCTSETDCKNEAKDGTWFEGVGAPAVACNETQRTCIAAVALPHGFTESGEGGACGDDVAIMKKCALGLSCVFPKGGPISEHTPGTCEK